MASYCLCLIIFPQLAYSGVDPSLSIALFFHFLCGQLQINLCHSEALYLSGLSYKNIRGIAW